MSRVRGMVKTFSESRGFGFIAEEEGGDIFFHKENIINETEVAVGVGRFVEYESEEGPHGLKAIKIQVL